MLIPLRSSLAQEEDKSERHRARGLGQKALLAKYCWQETPGKRLLTRQCPQEGMG